MKIATPKLLLVIAALWFIAGLNILTIGIHAAAEWHDWWVLVAAVFMFAGFSTLIFTPVIKRYTARIKGFSEQRLPFWRAFDLRGYLIIVVMMSAGIALRTTGIVPGWFIALFYLGLGSALVTTSLAFVHNYFALMWRQSNANAEGSTYHHHHKTQRSAQ